jgi:ATP-dependent DNA helicase HFM1/MER3
MALFEIAMARFFSVDLNARNGSSQQQVSHQRKIVYVAPSKALCEERFKDWTRRLSHVQVGIQCAMITGDAEPGDSFRDVAAAHVILTTPEKWDSLTRRWTENVFLFGSVKLLLLDEVHLLGDGSHGCCLESIVCRMKTIQRAAMAASDSYDAHCPSR